jgi:hypothetical protein
MECGLDNGELMQVAGGKEGLVLRCLKGTLWVTQGDGTDYIVHQGSCFKLKAGATALLEGIGSAEMRLEAAPCKGPGIAPLTTRHTCHAIS